MRLLLLNTICVAVFLLGMATWAAMNPSGQGEDPCRMEIEASYEAYQLGQRDLAEELATMR